MTNEKIEEILAKAISTAYTDCEVTATTKAIELAKDDLDYNEVEGMSESEIYKFYYSWVIDCIRSTV